MYSRVAEPLIVFFYDMYIFPAYTKVLNKVPFFAPVLNGFLRTGSWLASKCTGILESITGKP